jgi:hypothetical protein
MDSDVLLTLEFLKGVVLNDGGAVDA